MAKKTQIYMHKPTGNIMTATKSQAKKLGDEWLPIEFTKNEQGEPVMRFKFDQFTVDVSPTGEREVTPTDGNRDSE